MKVVTIACIVLSSSLVCGNLYAYAGEGGPTVQALLGAVNYSDFEIRNSTGSEVGTIDVSTLPQLGGAWSTAPRGETIKFGLECSFLLGFSFESASYSPSPDIRVHVNYDIWTFDIAGGLYATMYPGKSGSVRLYAAAGPLIMPTLYYSESYQDNTIGNDAYYRKSESAFGYGLYARTGVEFNVQEAGMLGFGLRGSWVDIGLNDVDSVTGIGAFLTYTADL